MSKTEKLDVIVRKLEELTDTDNDLEVLARVLSKAKRVDIINNVMIMLQIQYGCTQAQSHEIIEMFI